METSGAREKVIARIKGGLGNQLFCYAAARRLALVTNADLIIDDVTGFSRDRSYRRRYALEHFHIPVRKATPNERMEPFERYRRWIVKWSSRRKPFAERRYIEQHGTYFDERLLDLRVNGTIYLDGVWASEGYFKDVEQTIRGDLRIVPPPDTLNRQMAEKIRKNNAVAVHVRCFDASGRSPAQDVSPGYYQRAIALMERAIDSPRYFLFSDDPLAAAEKLSLPESRVTLVVHNAGGDAAYADLWLMTQCQHFITANSTFSWWSAWLGGGKEKIVVTPEFEVRSGHVPAWHSSVQIPNGWLRI